MTIASTTSKLLYNGDGATTVFAISFVFWQTGDIRVIHRDANGAETLWAEGTHYTIAGGAGDTGTLTVSTTPTDHTPAAGEMLLIKSAIAEVQQAALPLGGAFPSTTVEQMADIATRLVQQNSEKHERTIRVPEADPAAPLVELPPRAARAGKMIGFDSAGQLTALEPTDASAVAATAAGSTTSRLLAERFADVINVKDYGAVGDGVTDDEEAFQAAINAATDGKLTIIAVPNGSYAGDLSTISTGSRTVLWLHLGQVTYPTAAPPGNRYFDQISAGGDVAAKGHFLFDATGPDTAAKNALTVNKIDDGAIGAGLRINQTFDENANATGLPWSGTEIVKTKSEFAAGPANTVAHYAQNIALERTDKGQISGLFGLVAETGDTRPNGSFGTDPIAGAPSQAAIEVDVVANSPQTDFGTSTIRQGIAMVGFGGGVHTAGYVLSASQNTNARSHTATAQASAATTITLAATAMPVNDYYNTRRIKIYEGTGAGQVRTITDYLGATKVATVDAAWTTNPDATSKYVVFDVYNSAAWKHGISIRQGSILAREGIGIYVDTIPQGTADFGSSHGVLITGKSVNADLETFSRGKSGAVKFGSDINTVGQAAGIIRLFGYNDSNAKVNYATMRSAIITNTAAAETGRLDFLTYQGGTEISEGQISGGMKLGSPAGGFKGVGTLNAVAVYDDNVLLTCAPIEHAISGKLNLRKWNKLAPGGRHHAANVYKAMLMDGYQPQSADAFTVWLTRHSAVPGLFTPAEWSDLTARNAQPSLGMWSQRSALALDLVALAVVDLNKRLAVLEAKP